VKEHEIFYLLYKLAKRGAHERSIWLSTASLAEDLNLSPKTVSRKLIELEALGFIRRRVGNKGQYVSMTNKGVMYLRTLYEELKSLAWEGPEELSLRGKVFKGLGEGAYYVSLKHYRREFLSKLGFEPFPGTLNLLLDEEGVKRRRLLDLLPGITIKGFKDGIREYGSAKAFKALIANRLEGAVLLIDRTHYGPEVIEVISPFNLRRTLNLKDGDCVSLRVFLIARP